MIRCAWLVCRKDLRLVLLRGGGLTQALLLGLLLVFLFSLSLEPGDLPGAQAVGAIFWLASAFCQVLIFNMLYALEETNSSRLGLLLSPAPVQAVWLGKGLAGLCIIGLSQCLFIPAVFVFLGADAGAGWPTALLGLLLIDIGLAACGSLLGALSVGQGGRESLLSIILFPLLIPLLLAGVRLIASGLQAAPDFEDTRNWLGLAAAFDATFLAAGLALFPFLYRGED